MADLKKITNEELLEELKTRGFWTMSDRQNPVQRFLVSVNPPTEQLLLGYDPNWNKYKRHCLPLIL